MFNFRCFLSSNGINKSFAYLNLIIKHVLHSGLKMKKVFLFVALFTSIHLPPTLILNYDCQMFHIFVLVIHVLVGKQEVHRH